KALQYISCLTQTIPGVSPSPTRFRTGDHTAAVGGDRHTQHVALVSRHRGADLPLRSGIPDPHRAVLSTGDHATAVGSDGRAQHRDRKSTRLNSSHGKISYAVFCLRKK